MPHSRSWFPSNPRAVAVPVQLPLKELGAAQKKEVGENQGREVVLMHDAGRFIPTPRILEVGVLVYGRMSRVKIWRSGKGTARKLVFNNVFNWCPQCHIRPVRPALNG